MKPSGRRYVCIHGHFYQPPRENPWLDAIEAQESASPYHDWNERITAECYAPNAAARVLNASGDIEALRNNFEHLSFNVGPTLMAWLEQSYPSLHAQIVLADRRSEQRLGCGNALAQVYGHCILPLASARDQLTQVRWGIADFKYRFGRSPQGMWLPETAVDLASLSVLAKEGIAFTILAPAQAAGVREGNQPWVDVDEGSLDTSRPYRCLLAEGRQITLFFYDGRVAHDVAFGGLLHDGLKLAGHLQARAAKMSPGGLVHMATDGESYGHHHRFGEMALAAALEALQGAPGIHVTNYASYLRATKPTWEVEIRERSAWSCAHGLERWRSDCGCNSGGNPGWSQTWRTPLRETLDWLKLRLDVLFEQQGAGCLQDPWMARDDYIEVLLRRHDANLCAPYREHFLAQHRRRGSEADELVWDLLEMQRFGLLCFTSCAWFFDDCAGIETTQILTYAARAVQLAAKLGENLEGELVERLASMRSNLPGQPNGRTLYRQLIRPRMQRGHRD